MIWNLAAAGAVMALAALRWVKVSTGFAVASILMLLVSLLVLRRLAIRRYLGLEEDAILLPTGFLQLRTVRIPYKTIVSVWESRWAFGTVLYLRAGHRKFEIPCGLPLDKKDYLAVRAFLTAIASDTSEAGPTSASHRTVNPSGFTTGEGGRSHTSFN